MSYEKYNAREVLAKVEEYIEKSAYAPNGKFRIGAVCNDLSIFDWWPESIGVTGLKAMRSFLKNAIRLGYDGYVCFKVGAKYCASGMWAYKNESSDGYSPDGACIYKSFYSTGNYYDACDDDGNWLCSGGAYDRYKSIRQLEKAIAC